MEESHGAVTAAAAPCLSNFADENIFCSGMLIQSSMQIVDQE